MSQRDNERLDGRNGQVWARYVAGWTQARIAVEFGVSQQRVSQVLDQVRASIPDGARADAVLLAQERMDALLAAVWPDALAGDPRAVAAALRVLERLARALGTDAPQPLAVQLEQRLDLEAETVSAAVSAALDVLDLDPVRHGRALAAARAALLGEEPPVVVPVAAESAACVGLVADVEAFLGEMDGDDG